VLEFVISVAIGVAVAAAWMAVWALMLSAFGIPVLMRSLEERAARKERILQMGRVRYILIFGVLGSGFGFGLGIAAATMMTHDSANWGRAAAIFGAVSIGGCFNGIRGWNQLFHTEVPFPPVYPPLK
jgi:O-antigen/teichoic acid export membrane protein